MILMLNIFNYKDLKKLNTLTERLEEAMLVIQLDMRALEDVYQYYQLLPQSNDIGANPIPSYSASSPWPDNIGFRRALARCQEAQWKFKPLIFGDNIVHRKQLPPERILPVVYEKSALTTSATGGTVSYRASVYPCCMGFRLRKSLGLSDVVLKMLDPGLSGPWQNEVEAYAILGNQSPDFRSAHLGRTLPKSSATASPFNGITRCLGSFTRTPAQSPQTSDDSMSDTVAKDIVNNTHVIVTASSPACSF
jgi:hypothetical protein